MTTLFCTTSQIPEPRRAFCRYWSGADDHALLHNITNPKDSAVALLPVVDDLGRGHGDQQARGALIILILRVGRVLLVVLLFDEGDAGNEEKKEGHEEGGGNGPLGNRLAVRGEEQRPPDYHLAEIIWVPAIIPQTNVAPQLLVPRDRLEGALLVISGGLDHESSGKARQGQVREGRELGGCGREPARQRDGEEAHKAPRGLDGPEARQLDGQLPRLREKLIEALVLGRRHDPVEQERGEAGAPEGDGGRQQDRLQGQRLARRDPPVLPHAHQACGQGRRDEGARACEVDELVRPREPRGREPHGVETIADRRAQDERVLEREPRQQLAEGHLLFEVPVRLLRTCQRLRLRPGPTPDPRSLPSLRPLAPLTRFPSASLECG
eukprot:CAMPEP_0206235208 /NCGR_PEP_ID=MMETSP0047_2-20121206/13024_1 /ASSEMBLY_ACC=CAM_ASM_000192 /TAXON_ID=195065 /ORGANISM="Chroomonas mesostigmatica_cf, Strain CCMP1168" /LENGTH=380 /DNA_ID=CAMNT_0053659391 /DNA_START=205 /DNA_END=1342 /DNA_ORIENTATION=+